MEAGTVLHNRCMFIDARSAWERSDTTAQYCAGFFCSGPEVMFSPYSNYLKKLSTVVHPPSLYVIGTWWLATAI